MEKEEFIEKLKECRSVPRRMHISHLQKVGLFDKIGEIIPSDKYTMRQKIDIIILDKYDQCYCGDYVKIGSKWCSAYCKDHDVEVRKKIGAKNSANKVTRAAKMKETLLERYGVESVQAIPSVKAKTKAKKQDYFDNVIDDTFSRYGLDREKLSDFNYLRSLCNSKGAFEIMREDFNGIPYTTMIRHFERIGFEPDFREGSSSHGEREMQNWIKTILPDEEIIVNGRKILNGKEIDIYLPNYKIGIEYHGLYWHSDSILDKKGIDAKQYHHDKYILAKNNGVRLLQFFEDEWETKKEIVKSIIKSKLGLYDTVLYARKCKIAYVESSVARDFLEKYHIQGKIAGKHLGLFYDGELVSMITVGKSRFKKDNYELYRFVTRSGVRVVGGLSKLISHIKKDLGCSKIDTYADLRYSDGDSYSVIGNLVGQSDPGYFWVQKKIRLNRFSTQKHKLPALLGDKFDPALSEKENMENSNWYKIYDCGNKVFEI